MKYTISFINKNGKVKGIVGANTEETKNYLINVWATSGRKGCCKILNNDTMEVTIYKIK